MKLALFKVMGSWKTANSVLSTLFGGLLTIIWFFFLYVRQMFSVLCIFFLSCIFSWCASMLNLRKSWFAGLIEDLKKFLRKTFLAISIPILISSYKGHRIGQLFFFFFYLFNIVEPITDAFAAPSYYGRVPLWGHYKDKIRVWRLCPASHLKQTTRK